MISQVGLRPTGGLNCARFARNSPKKMSPDIYHQPHSCATLNKKVYLYYLPPCLPAQPSLQPLPPSLTFLPPSHPAQPSLHPLPPSLPFLGKLTFPESQFSREVKFPRKSNFQGIHILGSQISREVKFPWKSNFPESQLSLVISFPGKSTFPGSHFSPGTNMPMASHELDVSQLVLPICI